MGPAAWAAVGRALGQALITSLFGGQEGIVAIVAKEIHDAILRHDVETAKAMLRDLAKRHRKIFEEFMSKYGDEIPKDAASELWRYARS